MQYEQVRRQVRLHLVDVFQTLAGEWNTSDKPDRDEIRSQL